MEKYKLSDHIHYDRNDPSTNQSVYFDVAPDFYPRLNAVIGHVEESLNRDRVSDIRVALERTTKAIESAFGELTLGELLYVSHYVSSMLTANTAQHMGYEQGFAAAMAKFGRPVVNVKDIFGRKQNGGNA